MQFNLDDRTCALSVGEFADFTIGPRDAGEGGASGLWRAELGRHWHDELRRRAQADCPGARFEVPVEGRVIHRGWTLTLSGRIDQIVALGGDAVLREIKTVLRPLPAPEIELRAEHPGYFVQLAAYAVLLRSVPRSAESRETMDGDRNDKPSTFDFGLSTNSALMAELLFVEAGSGLTQTVALAADDDTLLRIQLERVAEFLDLRARARERLRGLRFRPAFAVLRPGQENIQQELSAAFHGAIAGQFSSGGPASVRAGDGAAREPSTCNLQPATTLFFEAPTGFGKTGVILEYALGKLREGRFSRLVYLTGKSTGQLQVMRTLTAMTSGDPRPSPLALHPPPAATPVAAWQVRPKAEHCVNEVFHCVREACPFLADLETRWRQSGLARFYLFEDQPRDIESLRAAGLNARICPYEITRAALPFNDVWIGDYNYVFAPDSRGVFHDRPGFTPSETLLVIDEAHNLPARVADAWSHVARAADAGEVLAALRRLRPAASLVLAWEHWTSLLAGLKRAGELDAAAGAEVRDAVETLAHQMAGAALDYAALGPHVSARLWQIPALRDWLAGDFTSSSEIGPPVSGLCSPVSEIPTLLWSPRAGELHFTILDAAPIIGETLRAYGGVILMSATLSPVDAIAAACGLDATPCRSLLLSRRSPELVERAKADAGDKAGIASIRLRQAPPRQDLAPTVRPSGRLGALGKRETRKLYTQLTSAAELLRVEEEQQKALPRFLCAHAPWRDRAYAVGIDLRVDTTFQHRAGHYSTTAATVEALHAAQKTATAVFFPSYAYAESIIRTLEAAGSQLRVALQPRPGDLNGGPSSREAVSTIPDRLAAWVDESLARMDALFLVLGSSFSESIDLLGGRVTHAMVVGPALPEVNAVQRAKLASLERTGFSRDAVFRRVYQIPGMTKVNQALGRLVRAPGQHAKALLHCRRFAQKSYASLLAPEYQSGREIFDDAGFTAWLAEP